MTAMLRRAAALARETARTAAHDGRIDWTETATLGSSTPVAVDDPDAPSVVIEATAARYEDVVPHIALWDPRVAMAVADLLDEAAKIADFNAWLAPRQRVSVARAEAVARALLDGNEVDPLPDTATSVCIPRSFIGEDLGASHSQCSREEDYY